MRMKSIIWSNKQCKRFLSSCHITIVVLSMSQRAEVHWIKDERGTHPEMQSFWWWCCYDVMMMTVSLKVQKFNNEKFMAAMERVWKGFSFLIRWWNDDDDVDISLTQQSILIFLKLLSTITCVNFMLLQGQSTNGDHRGLFERIGSQHSTMAGER